MVEKWLDRFGAAKSLRFNEAEGTFSVELLNDRRSPVINLVDTGLGASVSQILPLIVQGSTDEPRDSVIIAEQPEIHLNPKSRRSSATSSWT